MKIYKRLSKDQRERGVVFASTLSNSKEEMQGDKTHEVMSDDPERNEKIERLKDDKFFKAWKKYNIIRT